MPIQLVTNDHEAKLRDIFLSVENQFYIVSPFIGFPIVKQLCSMLVNNPKVRCEVITRFAREDFVNGASNLYAHQELLQNGVQIYALRGLHTKLYLIDKKSAMLGSANFTSGGFKLNHELSLFIKDETKIIEDMHNYYDELMSAIKSKGDYLVTQELVDAEIAMVESLRKGRKDKTTSYSNEYQFGALLDKDGANDTGGIPDSIQSIISISSQTIVNEGIWLKFEGEANDREDPNEKYWLFTPNKYPHGITCFPTNNKPSGMKVGDYIYIAVVSTDEKGNNTPIIVGRARTYGFEKENVADESMRKIYPWTEHYSVFVRLYDVEYLNTEQKNGISLIDVIAEVGPDTYPSTIGTSKPLQELRTTHYQKSHLRITHQAKDYLDMRFNQKAKQYGVCKA